MDVDCGGSESIGPGAVYQVDSPNYPKWYPSRETCSRTFDIVPGTKLTVECDVFRTKGWGRRCRGDRVDMIFKVDGKSQRPIRFCGRELENHFVQVEPHTSAYSVVWRFRSDKKRK